MTKTRPFTQQSLLKYPPFTQLSSEVKAYALSLFENDKLNDTGNFKRPPNAFFMFRRERSAQIVEEHKATVTSNPRKGISQKEISLQVQNEWGQMSAKEKEPYGFRAATAREQHYEEFPHYEYTPISDLWWAALTGEGKKRFFFDTMVKICDTVIYNTPWTPYFTIQEWALRPAHESAGYTDAAKLSKARSSSTQPAATPRHAVRGLGREPVLQSAPALLHQVASHPYKAARLFKEIDHEPTAVSWLDNLKSQLVYLGPRTHNGPARTQVLILELLLPRPQGTLIPVYVGVEISPEVPQDVAQPAKIYENSIPNGSLVLWDYAQPQAARTTHSETVRRFLPQLSIPEGSHLSRSPSMSSSTPLSGTAHSISPITPVQPEYSNQTLSANHWNQFSGAFDTCGMSPTLAYPTSPQFTQLLQSQPPVMNSNPTNVPLTTYTSGNAQQSYRPSPLVVSQAAGYFDANPAGPQSAELDFSWLSELGSGQSCTVPSTFDFQSILPYDSNHHISEEETRLAFDHIDRTFQAMGALL